MVKRTGYSSDGGGSGSGLGGLVLMRKTTTAGHRSFLSGDGSVDSESQNCNHSRAQRHSQPE